MNPTQRYNDLRKLVASLKTDDLAVLQRDINLILSLHEPISSKTPVLDAVDWKPLVGRYIRTTAAQWYWDLNKTAAFVFNCTTDKATAICRELGLDPDARG